MCRALFATDPVDGVSVVAVAPIFTVMIQLTLTVRYCNVVEYAILYILSALPLRVGGKGV